jgi:hypothetical protein
MFLELGSGTLNTGVNSNLFLLSTSTSHVANINDFGANSGTLVGNVFAQRYVGGSGYIQHQIGSPVSTNLQAFGAGGGGGFYIPLANCDETQGDPNTPYGNVFEWHENVPTTCISQGWEVKNGTNPAVPGKGYSVYLTGNNQISVFGAPKLSTELLPKRHQRRLQPAYSAEQRSIHLRWWLESV